MNTVGTVQARRVELPQGRTRQAEEYKTTGNFKAKLPVIDRDAQVKKKLSNLVKKEPVLIQVVPKTQVLMQPKRLGSPKLGILPKLATPKSFPKNEPAGAKARKLSVNAKSSHKKDRLNLSMQAPFNERSRHSGVDNSKHWDNIPMPSHDRSPKFQKLFSLPSRLKEEHKRDLSDYHYMQRRDNRRVKKIGPTIEELIAIRRAPEKIWECISSYEKRLTKMKHN
eukprot:TRINITY_DN7840_c0_g4_i1.p1 TRINITY_DN7840_c0_g4~~TRINITY_DN7840_c0_g4_i1.p1  ORF type:complete len:224 (+),score=52.35 TRINITY_DN7840_c0_g4_i1:93-764(+)